MANPAAAKWWDNLNDDERTKRLERTQLASRAAFARKRREKLLKQLNEAESIIAQWESVR